MSPSKVDEARKSIRLLPVVSSSEADAKYAESLRRLGVDEGTVAKLTGQTSQVNGHSHPDVD